MISPDDPSVGPFEFARAAGRHPIELIDFYSFSYGVLTVFLTVGAGVAFAGGGTESEPQDRTVVDVMVASDTNILDWYSDVPKPMFEEAHREHELNLVHTGAQGAGGNGPIADRTYAALQTGDDPLVSYFETWSPFEPIGAFEDGLWLEIVEGNVPNVTDLAAAVRAGSTGFDVPYRGSPVIPAYNAERFGTGELSRADINAINAEFYADAREMLDEIDPYLFDDGAYPSGAAAVTRLLTDEVITMTTIWSDQALQARGLGLLPPNTRFIQLEDLPMVGGYASSTIPANATNVDGAPALANFLLSSEAQESVVRVIGGFPAVSWDTLPAELQEDHFGYLGSVFRFQRDEGSVTGFALDTGRIKNLQFGKT